MMKKALTIANIIKKTIKIIKSKANKKVANRKALWHFVGSFMAPFDKFKIYTYLKSAKSTGQRDKKQKWTKWQIYIFRTQVP